MIRTFAGLSVVFVLCSVAIAQAPAPRPEFQVAVVKLNKSGQNDTNFDMLPSGQFAARNVPMNELFQFAFNVRRDAVSGAPAWFNEDRFDITGKALPNTPDDAFAQMVQSLLIQEFKLKSHIEQRTMSAFVLVVGKGGPKLQKAAGTGEADCKRVGAQGPDAGGQHVLCTNMKMQDLVDHLGTDLARAYIDKTVVDQTGLTGTYDFRLDWVGRANVDAVGGLTIFGSIERLGLKLEEKKLSLPVVVIDHVEKLSEKE